MTRKQKSELRKGQNYTLLLHSSKKEVKEVSITDEIIDDALNGVRIVWVVNYGRSENQMYVINIGKGGKVHRFTTDTGRKIK